MSEKKTYDVRVTFTGYADYKIETDDPDDIDQIIYDWLISNQYSINDVDDRSDYEVDNLWEEDE